jgi:hypothetical protein
MEAFANPHLEPMVLLLLDGRATVADDGFNLGHQRFAFLVTCFLMANLTQFATVRSSLDAHLHKAAYKSLGIRTLKFTEGFFAFMWTNVT